MNGTRRVLTARQNNTLVSSDNKGMAAYLYEHSVEPDSMPGNNTFIAGFTQCMSRGLLLGSYSQF